MSLPLYIIYGSATGNAEHIAKDLTAAVEANMPAPFTSVVCAEMDQFKKQKWWEAWHKPPSESIPKHGVLIVASTTGNGDPPENCSRYVRTMKRKTTSPTTFANVAFSVLGLGDTNYDKFCGCAVTIDKRMAELGGTRVAPLSKADEATGLEEVVEEWKERIVQQLVKAIVGTAVGGGEAPAPTKPETAPTPVETTPTPPKEAAVVTPTASNTNGSSSSSAAGVQRLRSWLKLAEETALPSVDASMLPSSMARRIKSCTWVNTSPPPTTSEDRDDDEPAYTAEQPFESKICRARYLTQQTSLQASEQMAQLQGNSNTWTKQAQDIVETSFPLDGPANVAQRNGKRVLEIDLTLPTDWKYSPGDAVGLIFDNHPEQVTFMVDYLQKDSPQATRSQGVDVDGTYMTVQKALERFVDLSFTPFLQAHVAKRILFGLQQHAQDSVEQQALAYLTVGASAAAAPNKTAGADSTVSEAAAKFFQEYVVDQRLSIVDILQDFPSLKLSLGDVLGILPALAPRYYSITSSQVSTPNTLSVALAVVDYLAPASGPSKPRRLHGLATSQLEAWSAPMVCTNGETKTTTSSMVVPIFPKPTTDFRLPAQADAPLILIGPGTGVAPFVGFLRQLQATPDARFPSVDLFFGCRHQDHDHLYRSELDAFVESGVLTNLHVAYSREGGTPGLKYVQDLMRQPDTAKRLVQLITQDKGRVYICGDGNQMAKDVQNTLVDMFASYSTDGNKDAATAYLQQLKTEERLLLDIWS